MEARTLQIRMLGKCSLAFGDLMIEDKTKRTSKVWLLLAYLVCNRDRTVSHDELIERLWEDGQGSNPAGALKTTLWRARQLLEELDPSLREVIVHAGKGYGWNPDIPITVDAEEFERLCAAAEHEEDEAAAIGTYREALELYQSDFLERFSSEAWVSPLTAYYSNLYISAVLRQLALLEKTFCAEEAVALCYAALKTSPYHEEIYQYLMRAQMELREFEKADAAYEELRERLFNNLGVMPGKESQMIHKEVLRHINHYFHSADMLRDQLQEKDPTPGPLICDFYVFRQFYQEEARSASRRGDAIHVCMLTVSGKDGEELPAQALEQVMGLLQAQMSARLRQGDVVSRCSASQFVLLLQANFENSNMVCGRIVAAFEKANPFTAVNIQHTVLSLEPLQMNGGSAPAGGDKCKTGWKKTK